MRKFIIALCAALSLAGCQTSVDAVRRNFSAICTGVEVAHTSFMTFSDVFSELDPNILKTEDAAYREAADFCSRDPATIDVAAVSLTVVRLTAIITRAIVQAQRLKEAKEISG